MDCVPQAVIYNRALPVFVSDRHSVMAVRKVTDNTQQGPPLISCSFKLVALFFLVMVWGDQGRVSLKLNVINEFFFFFAVIWWRSVTNCGRINSVVCLLQGCAEDSGHPQML